MASATKQDPHPASNVTKEKLMQKYRKAIVATFAGAIGWATMVVNSAPAHITSSEWIAGATALSTVVLVWLFPNDPA